MNSAVAYAAPSQMDELALMGLTAPESPVYWPTVRCPVTGLRVKRPQWADGTRPVWRLELHNGMGVYAVVNVPWDAPRHPDPRSDFPGAYERKWSSDYSRFGFQSYEALAVWFDHDLLKQIYAQRYADDKIGLALYRAHIILESARQCVFDIRTSSRIAFKPLTMLMDTQNV